MSTEPRPSPAPEFDEQLSAYCDGELAADSRRFLARRLAEDAELKQAWSRYHLIGDALRGRCAPPLPVDFASRVSSALEAEASATAAHPWLRWVGGAAVAASVALMALLVVPQPGREAAPQPAATLAAEVVASPLREADLRPDLSRAAQVVSGQGGIEAAPPVGSVPVRYIPVLQPDGSLVLMPYSPIQPLQPSHPLAPPLKPVDQR